MSAAANPRPFTFDTVFDGERVIAPPKVKRVFTAEEVEAARAEAFTQGQRSVTAQAEAEMARTLSEAVGAIRTAFGYLTDIAHGHRTESAELALVCARRIADAALEQFPEQPAIAALEALSRELDAQPRLLVRAHGGDVEAREGMSLAATLAGLAFSNVGVAAVHALEYPLGGATHCSHGAGNGLLLPFVMRYNLPARRHQLAVIARLLGADVDGRSETDAAEAAISAVEQLRRDIGIPLRLRDLGVTESQLRPFAEKAFSIKRILRVNPRPVTVEDLEGILRAAF